MRLIHSFVVGCALLVSGCNSMGGFSLWPTSFPLLDQTKEIASRSPMPSGLPHELVKEAIAEYYIEPGDRILIEPNTLESEFRMVGDQEVHVDGSIDLGEYGRLRVAGLTVEAIEEAIEGVLASNEIEEDINVQLVETNAAVVYVLGEVGSPGAYELEGRELVLDGILKAGGLTSKASPCDIILVRPTDPCDCRVVLPVCYRQITQLGDVTTNYQLQPGDRIVVGARSFCEEIAFWRQRTACERCCRTQCVERQPRTADYRTRFLPWMPRFGSPRVEPVAAPEQIVELEAPEATPSPVHVAPQPTLNRELNVQPKDDADIYLSPLEGSTKVLEGASPSDQQ